MGIGLNHTIITKKFAVYEDWTLEEIPRCFYVGKGDKCRVNSLKRNILHKNIRDKYGIKRLIVLETNNQNEAFELEIKLIREHKTFVHGGEENWGANFTIGGDGVVGYSGWHHTEEAKKSISRNNTGKVRTEEQKKITSNTTKLAMTNEVRIKISKANSVRIQTTETRNKRSKKWLGSNNPNFGKQGPSHPAYGTSITPIPIQCFSLDGVLIKEYRSISSTKKDGHTPSEVHKALKLQKLYHGYCWKKTVNDGSL